MTNGDRIRQMSNEKLAEIILGTKGRILFCHYCAFDKNFNCEQGACKEGIKAYLESEEE